MQYRIINDDWIDGMRELDDGSVQCSVTSPPYWALRDYGKEGQLGLEETPEEYVSKLVEGFREMWRVLADDGTFWLNLGDTYNSNPSNQQSDYDGVGAPGNDNMGRMKREAPGLKPKDLVGIPWRVALALQKDGWWLRNDIIWNKPNPMPESVTDRCTTSHEHIFLLTKSKDYFYDQDAVRKEHKTNPDFDDGDVRGHTTKSGKKWDYQNEQRHGSNINYSENGRNKRDVWEMTVASYSDAHFAVFPPELPETCIKAGTREGDTVLDPFCGAGTTGMVANRLGRDFIGIELNEKYCEMARERIHQDLGLFSESPDS